MKLINNREINLENLKFQIRSAIIDSYEYERSMSISLYNDGDISYGEADCYSPSEILSITLNYSQSENIEADIYNDYDDEYEKLYKQYENDEVERSELLDYIEELTGSKYDEHYISEIASEEEGSFISELEDFLSQEEAELKARVYKELKEDYEYKSDDDEIYEQIVNRGQVITIIYHL